MDLQSIFEKFCAFGTGKAGVAEMDSFKVWGSTASELGSAVAPGWLPFRDDNSC